MNIFNPEYNKKQNLFTEGIKMIRNRNNNFFLNARNDKSIYDLTDIGSYFTLYETTGNPLLVFRENSGLPEKIRTDVQALFDKTWSM